MRVLWLAEILRGAGLEVVELDGWRSRGRDLDVAYGVVVHDTVTTTAWTDEAVDRLLVNGKTGTPGPLYQLGVDRRGRFRIIASGRANHAGYSRPWGNRSIGIGVYCAGGLKGREEPWNDAQYESVRVGAGVILDHLRLGPSAHFNPRVAGHKEIDQRGKPDPYAIDMDGLRRDVGQPQTKEIPVDAVILLHPSEGTPDAIAGLAALFARPDQKVGLVVNVESAKQALREGKRVYAIGGPAAALVRGDKDLAGAARLDTQAKVLEQSRKGW